MADEVKPYASRAELEADLRRHREPPETLSDLSWSYIEDALYDRLLATAQAGLADSGPDATEREMIEEVRRYVRHLRAGGEKEWHGALRLDWLEMIIRLALRERRDTSFDHVR